MREVNVDLTTIVQKLSMWNIQRVVDNYAILLMRRRLDSTPKEGCAGLLTIVQLPVDLQVTQSAVRCRPGNQSELLELTSIWIDSDCIRQ